MEDKQAQARIALTDLMLNYAAAIDERDFDRYRQCFAEDVELLGFGDGVIHGRETWLDYVRAALGAYTATQHLLGTPRITLSGAEASLRTDVQATHFLPGGGRATLWATYLTLARRVSGSWRITRHELVVRGSD